MTTPRNQVFSGMTRGMVRLICSLLFMGLNSESRGAVAFEQAIPSETLRTNRMIRVYLPPGYLSESAARYPVLYVHDGQNAFSTVGSHVAYGWGNWELDLTADRLIETQQMRPIIMVAIDCSAGRYREYRGPVPPATENTAYARYARFLIHEVKPRIDAQYRTLTDPENTGVIGSSMGGICSLALAWEHPETFGLAASLSGAFQVERGYFAKQLLGRYHEKPKPIRVYLDSGTCDHSGGDDGLRETRSVADTLIRIGYVPGKDLLHFVDQPLGSEALKPLGLPADKFQEAQRSQHNELYWRLRAWRALTFLFPPALDGSEAK